MTAAPSPAVIDQFSAFGHRVLHRVTVVRDIKSRCGNYLARKGEVTWGALDGDGFMAPSPGHICIWTPGHYAGVKSSTVRLSAVKVEMSRWVRIDGGAA